MFGEIRNAQGERLDYTLHEGRGDGLVVIGHGVTGNKDRPFLAALAEGLSAAGLHALRFSFAGNGGSEGRFAECTISREVDDLGSVLDAAGARPLCYVGHSMGAAVGVLRAAADRRIDWLVSLAGMVHTRAFAEREFGDVTPDEGCMWDEPGCPLSGEYMRDMAAIDSVADEGAAVDVSWLLVHGTGTMSCPCRTPGTSRRGPRRPSWSSWPAPTTSSATILPPWWRPSPPGSRAGWAEMAWRSTDSEGTAQREGEHTWMS